MPSETTALLRSLRRWMLLGTFLLGVGVVAISNMGYVLTNHQDAGLWVYAGAAGGFVSLAACIQFVRTFLPGSADNRPAAE